MSIDDQKEANLKAYSRGQYSQAFNNKNIQKRKNMYDRTRHLHKLINDGVNDIEELAELLSVSPYTVKKDIRKYGMHVKGGRAVT